MHFSSLPAAVLFALRITLPWALQICQESRSYFKSLSARTVIQSKLHCENTWILGANVENLFAREFLRSCHYRSLVMYESTWRRTQIANLLAMCLFSFLYVFPNYTTFKYYKAHHLLKSRGRTGNVFGFMKKSYIISKKKKLWTLK